MKKIISLILCVATLVSCMFMFGCVKKDEWYYLHKDMEEGHMVCTVEFKASAREHQNVKDPKEAEDLSFKYVYEYDGKEIDSYDVVDFPMNEKLVIYSKLTEFGGRSMDCDKKKISIGEIESTFGESGMWQDLISLYHGGYVNIVGVCEIKPAMSYYEMVANGEH